MKFIYKCILISDTGMTQRVHNIQGMNYAGKYCRKSNVSVLEVFAL